MLVPSHAKLPFASSTQYPPLYAPTFEGMPGLTPIAPLIELFETFASGSGPETDPAMLNDPTMAGTKTTVILAYAVDTSSPRSQVICAPAILQLPRVAVADTTL